MSVSIRTKTKFPLLTTTALASTALMSAALLTVVPIAPALAANIVITTTVGATQNLGAGDTLTVTSTGSISGVDPAVVFNNVAATSITNEGTISGTGTGIFVNLISNISGGLINNVGGTISGGIIGINLFNASNISGGVINSGTISGGNTGINVSNTSNISGGLINNAGGTISGGNRGVFVQSNSDISGGLNNSGTISSGSTAILVQNNSDISGGIANNVGGTISGNFAITVENNSDITGTLSNSGTISGGSAGIYVQATSDVSGGITNSGTISGGNRGIYVGTNSDIMGGITNSVGGIISGGTVGLVVGVNSDISGGLVNTGTISGASSGISIVTGSDISGGITNSGTISSDRNGVYIEHSIMSGNITNAVGGTISGDTAGIWVRNTSNITGGVNNSGTISGGDFGILVDDTSDISGGITNSVGGTISGGQVGIYVRNTSNFSGAINNNGTISGGGLGWGILVDTSSNISGGITNSGTISDEIGIGVCCTSAITGGITNEVGGVIEGTGGTAISLDGLSAATPITINGGRIIGDVVDTATNTGRSNTTIAGDFTTEGNFTVSGLTVSAGQTLTISAGDIVSLYDMSASAGTFSFAVDSAASAGQLIVTNGNVDLSGASVSATVLNAGSNLVSGAEILIANGNAQVVGLTGGAGQIATAITDDSVLWSFQIADGSQSIVTTGGADDTEIYMIAMQVAMAADTATTPNNQAVGAVFDDLAGTGDPELSDIITNINAAGDAAELDAILEATLPSVDGGALAGGLRLSQNTLDITRTQLASLRSGETTGIAAGDNMTGGLRAWGQVFGESADQDRRDSVAGYDAQTLGVALGMDTQNAAEDTTLGLALSYGHTDVDSDNTNRTETDVDGYQVTLYGDHDFDDRTYITGLLGYVYGDNESTRHNVGGVAGLTANADYTSHQFVAEVETGRDYKVGRMKLTPNVLASYTHYSAEDYVETGAGGANLDVENDTLQMLELGVGLTAGWEHQTDTGGVLKPELRAGYRYDVIGDPVAATSRFTGGGASFKTEGFDPAQSSFNLGTGLTYTTPNNWELSASYDYEFKQDFDAHSGFLKAAYKF